MPESIKIAGKSFPKTGVYIAGAATVGIVGYAWFTKGGGLTSDEPSPEELAEFEIADSGDERIPATTIPTGSSFGNPLATNADWSELAVERLINIGHDGLAVSAAIGRFLDHKQLTKVEADLVREAIRAAGYPPVGGPWQVIETTAPPPPNTPTTLAAPAVTATSTPTTITLKWPPVMGATTYLVTRIGGGRGVPAPSRTHTSSGLKKNTTYTFVIRAVDGSGKGGNSKQISVRTKAK